MLSRRPGRSPRASSCDVHSLVAGRALLPYSIGDANKNWLLSLREADVGHIQSTMWDAFRRCALALLAAVLIPASAAGLTIESRVDGGSWSSGSRVVSEAGQELELRVQEVPDATIRWYRIRADLRTRYANARSPRRGGGWQGHDRIWYVREELRGLRGRWEIAPFRRAIREHWTDRVRRWLTLRTWRFPLRFRTWQREDVGTFWFQAEVEREGTVERTPGIESADHRGLSPDVLCVVRRDGDGFLGCLSGFYNVPGVFGSTLHQSRHHLGVDCADVLVAAWSEHTGRPVERNWSVALLVDHLDHVTEFDVKRGRVSPAPPWDETVRPGDLVAVRYRGWATYGHIGALAGDTNGNGLVDAGDVVLHAGPLALAPTLLGKGAFEGHVIVLRFPENF
ncbi:MAG: hypothetical protein GF405_01000 [Candidatus Eisenbacteria bacterium]|nr:hypothetical protein [Candidatus Eisenbacteria bacterium]